MRRIHAVIVLTAALAGLTVSATAQSDPNYAGGSADPEFEGHAGAVLHVNPNQPPGTYTGTFTLTVEYQ